MASTETKNNANAAIDQLCDLIDANTFGFASVRPRFTAAVPSSQVKAFRSSRLKRLKSTKSRSSGERTTTDASTTLTRRFSFCSSFLTRFRRLSTRSSTTSLDRPEVNLPSIPEEEPPSSTSTTACSIVETRRTTSQSCNVEELAAYLDNYLYLPKSLSGAAELMYT